MYVISVLITSTVDPLKRYTRHVTLDGLHGALCRHTGPGTREEPCGKKSSMGSEKRQIFRCNLKSIATRSIPPKRKRSLELVDILRIDCSSRIAACRVRGAERLRVLDESCELRGQTWALGGF